MGKTIASIFAAMLIVSPGASLAQDVWQWELASDVAFPVARLGPAKLKQAPGFDMIVSYRLTPGLGSYFAWNWHSFRADTALTGSKVDVNESGFVLGLQWRDRIARTSFDYRLRAGVSLNQIELEDSIAETRHGAGWEVGAALLVPLAGDWVLTPSIRYRSLSRNLSTLGQNYPVDLRYYTVGVGLAVQF